MRHAVSSVCQFSLDDIFNCKVADLTRYPNREIVSGEARDPLDARDPCECGTPECVVSNAVWGYCAQSRTHDSSPCMLCHPNSPFFQCRGRLSHLIAAMPPHRSDPLRSPVFRFHENERSVQASESARVGERDAHSTPTCDVWHVIKIALWIRLLLINRRWKHLLVYHEGSDNCLNCPGRSLGVTNQRLRCTDGDMVSVVCEDSFIGHGLGNLVCRGRTAMRIDIVKLGRCNGSLLKCLPQQLL